MNRRKFLLGASAVAVATVVKANTPKLPIAPYIGKTPEWMVRYPGWLLPRGQTLVRTSYPQLCAALGDTFGYAQAAPNCAPPWAIRSAAPHTGMPVGAIMTVTAPVK